jgi:hypothetical protein
LDRVIKWRREEGGQERRKEKGEKKKRGRKETNKEGGTSNEKGTRKKEGRKQGEGRRKKDAGRREERGQTVCLKRHVVMAKNGASLTLSEAPSSPSIQTLTTGATMVCPLIVLS